MKSTTERAFELADLGEARSVDEIKAQLYREGFPEARARLDGRTITAELRKRLIGAKAKRKAPS